MKIGLDISTVKTGSSTGVETYTQSFLKKLNALNQGRNRYYAFTTRNNLSLRDPSFRGIDFVLFPGNNERRWLRVFMQQLLIPYHSTRVGLDVVNFQNGIASLFLPCASVLHIKTLHHYHTPKSIALEQTLARRLLFGPSARCADLIIANTEYTRKDICRFLHVPADKVVVIPEGVDTDVFQPCRDGEEEHIEMVLRQNGVQKPYLLFVSALWPYKNPQALVAALRWLLDNRKDLGHDLVIVGGDDVGYLARLKQLAHELGLARRVRFLGHIADRKVVRCFYVGAQAFVYPSLYETFGLTVLEAMACGTPVVASNRTSLPEVVGDAGLLVDPENVPQLGQEIYRILEDDRLRRELIERGLERARHFSWERTVVETVRVYERAAAL